MKTTDGFDLVVPKTYYTIKDGRVKSKLVKYDTLVNTSNIYKHKRNAESKIAIDNMSNWADVIERI